MKAIQRYQPDWNEGVQAMERDAHGDYVEFSDHMEAVDALQARIDVLETAIKKASEHLDPV